MLPLKFQKKFATLYQGNNHHTSQNNAKEHHINTFIHGSTSTLTTDHRYHVGNMKPMFRAG
jgi:hypothetical protein